MNAGDLVAVRVPFTDSFPGVYRVREVVSHDDGQQACLLVDEFTETGDIEIGAFAPEYLEKVN